MSGQGSSGGQGLVEFSDRIGGSGSARLIALGVVVVLVGFVAVAILGREPAPPPVAVASPVASAAASASTEPPQEAAPTASPMQPPEDVAVIAPTTDQPRFDEHLALVLEVAGTARYAPLLESEPGHWQAAYHIPYPRPALEATIVLTQIPAPPGEVDRLSIGSWEVSFVPMTLGWAQAFNVLDAVEEPRRMSGASDLARSGFRISAIAESRLYHGILHVDIQRHRPLPPPNESYAVEVRAGRFVTRIDLSVVEPGRLSGLLVIPDRVRATVIELTLMAIPAQNPLLGLVTVHRFETALPQLDEFVTGHSLISVSPGGDVGPGEPELLAYDYRFSAATTYADNQRAFTLDLLVSAVDDEDGFAEMSIPWPPDRTTEQPDLTAEQPDL